MQPLNSIPAQGFPPIDSAHAHTLILGSMPGKASLEKREYYAHPRNAFWPIMIALVTGTAPRRNCFEQYAYAERCALLQDQGYAVWDVLATCERSGSLDSNIVRQSEQANPIAQWLSQRSAVSKIVFNGRAAETLFKRHCAMSPVSQWHTVLLPSTSPAMARLNLDAKYARWHQALLG